MNVVAWLALVLFAGFWDQKAPEEWTVEEVRSMMESSPWSRTLHARRDQLRVHLGSALPMRQAEKRERSFERRRGANDASHEEYEALVDEGKYIVLAVKIQDREAFSDGDKVRRLQKESEMRIGKKSYALVTHFPPSSTDPYLRLVFPRVAPEKSIDFTVFVPGALDPYQQVSFYAKDMNYRGKLEY